MKILLLDGTIIGRKTGAILKQVEQYIKEFDPNLEIEQLHLAILIINL